MLSFYKNGNWPYAERYIEDIHFIRFFTYYEMVLNLYRVLCMLGKCWLKSKITNILYSKDIIYSAATFF